jgi:hypothetical protein
MKKKLSCLLLLLAFYVGKSIAQDDDMLQLLGDEKPKKQKVYNAFKSSRVIMSHSMEMLRPGVLDFRILHRFGRINGGVYELFGLDGPATVRLALDYGITDYFTLGIGRSTSRKELDGFIKFRPVHQSTGPKSFPVSVVFTAGSTLNPLKWSDTSRKNYFSSRLAYYGQVIVGRKFNERITLQLMPTILHLNLVERVVDDNDIYSIGLGARAKISKRISINADYYYRLNPNQNITSFPPLSLGVDIETGGHVFQLHFTNSKGMNERSFLTDTEYSWGKGDVMFGFNISRAFQVRKRK